MRKFLPALASSLMLTCALGLLEAPAAPLKAEKPERIEKADKPERPDRSAKPDKPDKAEKPTALQGTEVRKPAALPAKPGAVATKPNAASAAALSKSKPLNSGSVKTRPEVGVVLPKPGNGFVGPNGLKDTGSGLNVGGNQPIDLGGVGVGATIDKTLGGTAGQVGDVGIKRVMDHVNNLGNVAGMGPGGTAGVPGLPGIGNGLGPGGLALSPKTDAGASTDYIKDTTSTAPPSKDTGDKGDGSGKSSTDTSGGTDAKADGTVVTGPGGVTVYGADGSGQTHGAMVIGTDGSVYSGTVTFNGAGTASFSGGGASGNGLLEQNGNASFVMKRNDGEIISGRMVLPMPREGGGGDDPGHDPESSRKADGPVSAAQQQILKGQIANGQYAGGGKTDNEKKDSGYVGPGIAQKANPLNDGNPDGKSGSDALANSGVQGMAQEAVKNADQARH